MKFKITSKDKGVKKVEVNCAWSGDNLYVQLGYELPDSISIYGTNAILSGDNILRIWITNHKSIFLCVNLIPETDQEKVLLAKCYSFTMSSDYCGTSVMLVPNLTEQQWSNLTKAKKQR